MSNARSPFSLSDFSGALTSLVAATAPALVTVRSHRSRSSGFVWRPGLVVTADEALAEEGDISVVLPGGTKAAATLVGRDPTTDIALLRLSDGEVQPATLETISVAPGGLAVAAGAQDGAPTVALGVVAYAGEAWRSLRGGEIDARIELDLRLRRQAEGGVALDANGRVFGMVVFGPRRRVLVIPGATIARVAARLESHGRVARGYLGLGLQPVTLDGAEGLGVMVMSVDPHGPGVTAGVKQGDVLKAWDGQALRSMQALMRGLGPDSVGTSVALSLARAGEPLEVRLSIAERPPA